MKTQPVKDQPDLARDEKSGAVVAKVAAYEQFKQRKQQRDILTLLNDIRIDMKESHAEICDRLDKIEKRLDRDGNG